MFHLSLLVLLLNQKKSSGVICSIAIVVCRSCKGVETKQLTNGENKFEIGIFVINVFFSFSSKEFSWTIASCVFVWDVVVFLLVQEIKFGIWFVDFGVWRQFSCWILFFSFERRICSSSFWLTRIVISKYFSMMRVLTTVMMRDFTKTVKNCQKLSKKKKKKKRL